MTDIHQEIAQSNAILSTAFALTSLTQYTHFLPTQSHGSIPYISSAIIASTFDAISIPFRKIGILEWLSILEPISSMSMSEISSCIPYPIPGTCRSVVFLIF